ncbi:CaiB/BaiF CoA transferase family protein [Jannaschia ovalis]|uniref:CaiB/BaiF CoA-transferase family protein n=1 Tax=Jannaschia ovalis TaxID=3038773 RepID=A0ABY8LC54_9RHOB|nr:CaiB/BaiF CoA-transferase family protein [Jannaschia sp. GRR-S6-38]WGH78909.1 CaiB/BaiF CoA-transferase family protein [Jannaschia sp. GRR-S6-38]
MVAADLPLAGLTVVALEHAVAAPFCTRQLADMGARVIKIERPGTGDFARGYDTRARGLSSHFVWTNRSKESLALDLRHEAAAEVLDALVDRADVIVQNLAPGAAARLGLGWDAVHARNPRTILCDISGYGAGNDRKAYDLLVQAEAGLVSVTGTPEVPSKAGISISDIAAGMYALTNILSALIARGVSGRGRHLDVSMLAATAEWMGYPMYYAMDGAPPPARAGAAHATIFPYGPFAATDGEVIFGLQNSREWQVFCRDVLGDATLAEDARFATNHARAANAEALRALIEGAFAGLTCDAVRARLDAAGIGNARLNDMAALWDHPALAGRWREVESPAGPLPALLPPGQAEARMDPIPALGQHSRAILAELGLSEDRIDALAAEGAI